MIFIFILFLVFHFSFCLETDRNSFPITIVRQTTSLASYETSTILCNNIRVLLIPEQKDNSYRELDESITRYDRQWYTLHLGSSHNVNWYPGSWIALKGEYGNVLIKRYLYMDFHIDYMFYPGYLIEKDIKWKVWYGLVPSSDWTTIDYNDSVWINVSLPQSSESSPQGFSLRHLFSGMKNLNVITISISYQCGIVVYLQNNEIFRDNIPKGPITPETRATGCYSSVISRLLTRKCFHCSEGLNVIAIALVSKETPLVLNQTSIWLAPQGTISSLVSETLQTCHIIDGNYSTSSIVQESQRIVDYNYLSSFTADVATSLTITLYSDSRDIVMNGLMFINLNHTLLLPLNFEVFGQKQVGWELIGRSYQGVEDFSDRTIGLFPFNSNYYKSYQIKILSTRSLLLELTELRFLSCNLEIPTTLELNTYSVDVVMFVDEVEIFPIFEGFFNCSLNLPLPSGLSFDPNTCSVTGRTETQFNQTFVLTAYNQIKYTTSFQIHSSQCEGMVILITRTYGENPSLETFVITNTNTNHIVYEERSNTFQHSFFTRELRFCLPVSHFSIAMDHENSLMWGCESFISASIFLVNDTTIPITTGRYDKHVGLDSTIFFSTMLLISPNAEWSYFLGSVPSPDWMTQPSTRWGKNTTDRIPFSPIQLFHRTFLITNITNMYTFQLYLRYKAGCIVYLNGIEIFRRFLSDQVISNSSVEHGAYEEMIYRVVSFPRYFIVGNASQEVLHEGSNFIAIGLVTKEYQPSQPFDCSLRMGPRQKRLLNFDYEVEVEGYESPVDTLLDLCSLTHFTFRGSDTNSITIRFKQDRREWASMFDVLASLTLKKEPTTAIIEAKNPEDEEWTLLSENENWYWWSRGIYKIIFLLHNKSYNMFRFRDITLNHQQWSLTSLLLYQFGLDSYALPNITYPPIEGYIGYPISEFYPSSAYCNNYYLESPLPAGLFMDPATGVIGGTPTESFNGTVTLSTLFLSSIPVKASVHIVITTCIDDSSIIIINVYSESYSNNEFLKLYRGRTKEELLWDFTCPSSSQYDYIFTFCLPPAIFTFVADSVDDHGWLFPAGYAISIQEEETIVSINHVLDASGRAQSIFTGLDPFPSSAMCTFIVDSDVSSEWKSRDFDDSLWNHDSFYSLPTKVSDVLYVRYIVKIPSLFDYRVLGINVHYSTCFIAYFNQHRVARVGLRETATQTEKCFTSETSTQSMTFYVLIAEMGGEAGRNCLAFEIHQSLAKPQIVFQVTGYFGVDEVNDMFNLIDASDSQSLYPLLDSDIKSFIQVDAKIGNLFDIELTNLEGQPYNSISYYCDQSIPIYNLQLFMRSPYAAQTPHPDYHDGMELLIQEDITSIRGRLKSVVPAPYCMGGYRHLRINDMYYQIESSNLQFSGILPSYSFKDTQVICPAYQGYRAVKDGEVSPGPCPGNQTGVATRLCQNRVLGDPDYSKCTYIPPANISYAASSFVFYVGIASSTGVPSYQYHIATFSIIGTLPSGLQLNSETGEIYGIPQVESTRVGYSIVGSNPGGEDRSIVFLEIQQMFCFSEMEHKYIPLFFEEWIDCSIYGKGFGRLKRKCELIGELPEISIISFCVRFYSFGFISIMLVFVCVLFIVCKMIRKRLLVRRILKISDSLYMHSISHMCFCLFYDKNELLHLWTIGPSSESMPRNM